MVKPGEVRPFERTSVYRAGALGAAVLLGGLLWTVLCCLPAVQWNGARLAPSAALARGLPIYALRDSGAHLGWFYGPVFPLYYLPAGLWNDPTVVLLVAGAMNIFTWLLPVMLVLRGAGLSWRAALTGTIVAGVLLLGNTVTNYGFYWVHVDGVCLALGLAACHGLLVATERGPRWGLHLAVLGVVAAAWTKVLAVGLVPAFLCWLWYRGSTRLIWPFCFWLIVHGSAVTAGILLAFGPEQVLFNVVWVHHNNPWRGGVGVLAAELGRLLWSAWIWLPAFALGAWLAWRTPAPRTPEAARRGAWVRLLVLVALWLLPVGCVAVLKAGGGLNSLHSVHFLFLAGLIALQSLAARPVGRTPWPGLLWLAMLAFPLTAAAGVAREGPAQWRPSPDQDKLMAMAREHPGRCYFPWSPLVTIVAENRVQPLDDALYCLWLVRLEPPAEKVRAAVPPNPLIVYVEPSQSRFALRYFPQRARNGGPEVVP